MNKIFRMPPLGIGDKVLWYTDCDRNAQPQMGVVMEASTVNCTIRLITRTGMDQMRYDVRHVDDPLIEKNQNIKTNGAWAYHPETVLLNEINDRLKKIELDVKLLSDVVTSPKGK